MSDNDTLVEELLKSIQSTTSLIQGLMSEIKSNEKALTTLEVKLEGLTESAKILSKIVRDDNGSQSILTRVALLENDLADLNANYKEFKTHIYKKIENTQESISKNNKILEKKFDKFIEEKNHKENTHVEKVIAGLKIVPGVLALVLVLVKLIWGIGG